MVPVLPSPPPRQPNKTQQPTDSPIDRVDARLLYRYWGKWHDAEVVVRPRSQEEGYEINDKAGLYGLER